MLMKYIQVIILSLEITRSVFHKAMLVMLFAFNAKYV